jgi:putative acetyltransferase
LEIRLYRNDDWAVICEIYDLSKPDELRGVVEPSAILPLEMDPSMRTLFCESQIVVMEQAGHVVGFAGNRDNFINWLFVHPAHRRNGVASALIRYLLGQLTGPVTLNVAKSNAPALALYEGIGFAVEREFSGNFQGIPCKVARLRHQTAA